MIPKIISWLSSPLTLIKLIRAWAVVGCLFIVLLFLHADYTNSVKFSFLFLALFVVSLLIEKVVVNDKNEDTSDSS